jgi:Zn-dependent M28 family amino/carboxypeptidase
VRKSNDIQVERLDRDVRGLIGPHGRLHAADAISRVERSILEEFTRPGWTSERRPFRLTEVRGAWDYGAGEPTVFPLLEGTNVLAIKEGEQQPREAVVVVAHYDTTRDSPGADDNTASVAALLELARVLSTDRFRRTVVLAATDMEELMFVGARALVEELRTAYDVKGAVILETMAYVDSKPHTMKLESKPGILYRAQWERMQRHEWAAIFTLLLYRKSASAFAGSLAAGLRAVLGPDACVLARDPGNLPLLGPVLRKVAPGLVRQFHRSDHVPFWDAGIPAVQVTDGANFSNPHYHRETDLPDTLDLPRLRAVTAAVAVTIAIHAGLILPGT